MAGILHHLGVKMGLHNAEAADNEMGGWDFMPPSEWCPKGFFQDSGFVNFAGRVYGFESTPKQRGLTDDERTVLKELIDVRASFGVDWGIKDPHIALYAEDFRDLCPHPIKIIRTVREHGRSVASWKARAKCGESESQERIAAIRDALEAITPDLTAPYDDLHDRPRETVAAIAAFCGREVTDAALSFLDPSLRRH